MLTRTSQRFLINVYWIISAESAISCCAILEEYTAEWIYIFFLLNDSTDVVVVLPTTQMEEKMCYASLNLYVYFENQYV